MILTYEERRSLTAECETSARDCGLDIYVKLLA